jgi:hypothetical protein
VIPIPFLLACQVNNGRKNILEVSHPTGTNVELPNASTPKRHFCPATLHRVRINAMVRISKYSRVVQALSGAAEHRPRKRWTRRVLARVCGTQLAEMMDQMPKIIRHEKFKGDCISRTDAASSF